MYLVLLAVILWVAFQPRSAGSFLGRAHGKAIQRAVEGAINFLGGYFGEIGKALAKGGDTIWNCIDQILDTDAAPATIDIMDGSNPQEPAIIMNTKQVKHTNFEKAGALVFSGAALHALWGAQQGQN